MRTPISRSRVTLLATFLLFLAATPGAGAQTPPVTLPGPIAKPPPPPPDEVEWAAALELKKQAMAANEVQPALDASNAFTAFRGKYPESPHAVESLIENGVCWMIAAKSLQQWHRNRPEGVEKFKKSIEWFLEVPKLHPEHPAAARAWFCAGLAWIQLDEQAKAEQCLTTAIEAEPRDRNYFGKALEKRASVRRHRLDTAGALADLERYKKEFAAENADANKQTEEFKFVTRHASYLRVVDKPAPELKPETWPGGEAVTLAKMRGEVVALYFFAHWCNNCEKESGFVREMSERWGPLGVRFVGVTDFSATSQGGAAGAKPKDPDETKLCIDTVKAYVARHAFGFPVMMDRGPTAQIYVARKYPEVVLIDREGRIRWHDHPLNLFDSTLETLLFGPPEAAGGTPPNPGPTGTSPGGK